MKEMECGKFLVSEKSNVITFLFFWSGLVVLCALYMMIPLFSIFVSTFHITPNEAAWTGSIFSMAFAIGCLIFGPVSDRFGRKKVIVSGLLGLSVVTFAIGLSNSFNQLLFFRAIQGMLAATFSPAALTYVGDMFPPNKQVTTIGFISSGFLMAGIIGQLFSSFIEAFMNWHLVFYVLSIVYFATTILLFFILPNDSIRKENVNFWTIIKKFKIPLKQKPLLLSYGIAVMILLSFVGMYTSLEHFLKTNFQFDDQGIFYVRAAGMAGMFLSPLTGKLIDKFGMKNVLNSGLFCSIIGLFSMGLSQNLLFTVLMSILFVSGIAIIVPSMIALIGQLGGSEKGIATAIYIFILFIGASIGPILATMTLKAGYTTLPFFIFGCILTIGIILSSFIHSFGKKTEKKRL